MTAFDRKSADCCPWSGGIGADLLVRETGAAKAVWNRLYDPGVTDFGGGLLSESWTVRHKSGAPFKVFTPFWRVAQVSPDLASLQPAPPGWRRLR